MTLFLPPLLGLGRSPGCRQWAEYISVPQAWKIKSVSQLEEKKVQSQIAEYTKNKNILTGYVGCTILFLRDTSSPQTVGLSDLALFCYFRKRALCCRSGIHIVVSPIPKKSEFVHVRAKHEFSKIHRKLNNEYFSEHLQIFFYYFNE